MPTFLIEAYDVEGRRIYKKLTADSRKDILKFIQEQGLLAADIKKQPELPGFLRLSVKKEGKMSHNQLSAFLRQFYALYRAGVSIPECVRVVGMQIDNAGLKRIFSLIQEKIETGNPLSRALAEHPGVFPPLLLAMIETGETTGYLEEVLRRMAVFYEKEGRVEAKIKSATIYPKFLALLSVALVVFMLTFILPAFTGMFEAAEVPLPAITRWVMAAGDFLYRYFVLVLIFSIIIWFLSRYLKQSERVREFLDRMKLKIPIVKEVVVTGMSARFSGAMSMLLKSGIPMVRALDITQKLMGNKQGERKIGEIMSRVDQGMPLAQAMNATRLFNPLLISTVRTGEGAGTLDDVLEQISDHFEEERTRSLERLLQVIEPLMIVIMAVVIGFIVISMIMPMFEMISQLS